LTGKTPKPGGNIVSNRVINKRGIALLMTILVIAALAAIAAPFAISMRIEHEQAKNYVDLKRARDAARAAVQHSIVGVFPTYPTIEYFRDQGMRDAPPDPSSSSAASWLGPPIDAVTPDYDGLDEIQTYADMLPDAISFMTGRRTNVTMSAIIEDENSKININTATPLLISNLLGYTQLAEDIEYNASEIPVVDSTPFFSDGNPDTYDGVIRIGRENIAYKHINRENNLIQGTRTGIFDFKPQKHIEGALVHDARGYKICEHSAYANPGRLSTFETPASIREIANWTKFDFLQESLKACKVSLEDLEKYGVAEDELRDVGINPDDVKKPEVKLSPEERREMAKVDRKIEDLGLIRKS